MSPFALMLTRSIKWIERIAILFSLLGFAVRFMKYGGSNIIMIGILTLSCVYFLSAFLIFPTPADNNIKKGFADLLSETVLPKLMYISLSVFCIGFLFAILHLKGADEMLRVGILIMIMGTFFSMILILSKRERMKLLQPVVIRVIVGLVLSFTLPLLK